MIVKIMHTNDGDDTHPRAAYRLFADVKEVDFAKPSVKGHTRPYVYLTFERKENQVEQIALELHGNVYIMNKDGKTFDRFEVQP